MSTILLWGAGIAISLALLLSLPLVKHIFKPVFDETVKFIGLIFAHAGSYVIWIMKSIFNAHVTVLRHLMFRKKHFDPTDGLDIER